ncbi:MAG TPA: S8 family serine peptidase [Pyrinomonadaceae bacterium]|jgi:subtilisin family serine protease|nr:S8 family serine peptidase [Pyrinomonadaceae bacterium]
MTLRHTSKFLGSLLLAAALCLNAATAGAGGGSKGKGGGDEGDGGRRDKVSSDLRERQRDARDDRRRKKGDDGKVQVILQLAEKPKGLLNAFLNGNGVHVNAKFKNLNALAVELPVSALEELAAFPEVSYVSADREVTSLGGNLAVEVGAEAVRQQTSASGAAYTLDGAGVGIAVLDSGIYREHKSFAGHYGGGKDYTGEGRTDDPFGHGTHVAGIAVGGAEVLKGKYVGVAPGATLYNLRVLNSKGVGTVSGVLAALDDLFNHHAAANIRVVNMSLGMPAVDSYKDDPVCRAVRKLSDAGVVVVAAAGNDGKDSRGNKVYGLIHAPGNEPSAITVGASNDMGSIDRADDTLTTFSSRGPTRSFWTDEAGLRHYDHVIKPDLVAPGNKIGAAQSPSNYLVQSNPLLDLNTSKFPNQKMMRLSGTSMAAPVVAGAAALMLQANPRLTPNMVKMALMYTAQQLAGANTLEQGAGEINVEGAVRLAKLLKSDLPAGTRAGTPFLNGPAPAPQTTIKYADSDGRVAATSFRWAQGIILNHTYAKGSELITAYQGIYGSGVMFGDGITFSEGVTLSDATLMTDGVVFSDQLLTSYGITISDGSPFLGAGVMLADGAVFADGVFFGDGVILSDGTVFGDSVTRGDYASRVLSLLGIEGGR